MAVPAVGEPAASPAAASRSSIPRSCDNPALRGGLTSFFFQYLLQAGLFFAVPLFLSVALGLSAIATGVRLLPLSITLLLAAVGIPKVFPDASPRRVVQLGFLALFAGIVVMVAALDAGAGPEIVTWPMLLAGLGIGALASQLGARHRVVRARRAERRGRRPAEHGHEPRRVDRHRAGRRGAHRRAHASFFTGIADNPAVPAAVVEQARRSQLAAACRSSPTPISRPRSTTQACRRADRRRHRRRERDRTRLDGLRAALAVVAGIALLALFFTRNLPKEQLASAEVATAVQHQ